MHAIVLWVAIFFCPVSELSAQQLANANFEDWSAPVFATFPQPVGWNASNVTQFYFKFNFAHREKGHSGKYCLMVQDQAMGAAGMQQVSPGYASLGQPWSYIENITKIAYATAGTHGGIGWNYRPDTLSVWIRRTGPKTELEDFYLLYYAWTGTSVGHHYKGQNGECTNVSFTNEESDIRRLMNANECGTAQLAKQICEGMWRQKAKYEQWTNIRVPIYYFSSDMPTMMNIIFSAGNYPNFRANSGYYPGNSLYIDDVSLIYSASIQHLYIDGELWREFSSASSDVQTYRLPASAKEIPSIEAWRGAGELVNARGKKAVCRGRKLSAAECVITPGKINGEPTTILVTSGDGKSQKIYKIRFVK